MKKYAVIMLITCLALCGCRTRDVMKQDKTEWDYEKYMVEAE